MLKSFDVVKTTLWSYLFPNLRFQDSRLTVWRRKEEIIKCLGLCQ